MSERVAELAAHMRDELARVVVGQREPLDQLLISILCGGHAILEGVPGTAKTLAVKALARICGLAFQRVQCTPDLMPADVVGTSVYNMARGEFSLKRGPVFTDLLLVDEINRTPPRTQSALLEAMEERQVTIDGARHPLAPFFTVFATQNPVEFEGTYPLPEAQLDRFLVKIRVDYPDADQESEILKRCHEGFDARDLAGMELRAIEAALLGEARREVTAVQVEPGLLAYITALARRTREWPSVSLGASPRAAVALLVVAKGAAALDGRGYLIPDDVKRIAPAVLRHRLVLKPEAELEGGSTDQVIAEVLATVEVPK